MGLLAAVGLPAIAAAAVVIAVSGHETGRDRLPPVPDQIARAAEVQAGRTRDAPAHGRRPAVPFSISIPSANIAALVEPVSARRGVMRVPDIGRAGWYDAGPRPGEVGRAVIIGHLDTRKGPGLFARVPRLKPGAAITVMDRRGVRHRYEVVGSAQVRKKRFPADQVYGGAKAPVLVLVTCGGPFVEGEGYRDNVLLYARAA